MKIWLKIALNAVRLPKFESVNGNRGRLLSAHWLASSLKLAARALLSADAGLLVNSATLCYITWVCPSVCLSVCHNGAVKTAKHLGCQNVDNMHICDQRWKPVGSTGASWRSDRVTGRVGSTLSDRFLTGRPHKMQSGTRTKRGKHDRLKLTRDVFI